LSPIKTSFPKIIVKKTNISFCYKTLGSAALIGLTAFGIGRWLNHRPEPTAVSAPSPQTAPAVPAAPSFPPLPPVLKPVTLAEEAEATANAKPCDYTILTNLDLTRPPTEAELIAAGNLGEKLTPTRSADPDLLSDPVARKQQQQDNLTFGTAIQAWNDHRYAEALELFTAHVESAPESPWVAESMLHIGCHHQYVARFSESVEWFDKILEITPKNTEMYYKAKLRRTILNVDLGKLDEAIAGFSEMIKQDPNSNHQSYASYWLIQIEFLKKNETALRDCGQKALSHAAKILGNSKEAAALYRLSAAGPHGFNASELHATALAHGLVTTPVRADAALDALPVPFIAHYTDRHYVTVESVTKDAVTLYDSRISASTAMPRKAFEKNWSGFALLTKPAPDNQRIHPAENLEQIIGGCCGQPAQVSDLGGDDCHSCGLPTYSVNPINMNFKVIDTPMWWEAPVGPSVFMKLLFNSQDSLNNYEPFGEKWSFRYASYLLITPGDRVQVKDGDGKLETFPAPVGGIPDPVTYPITYQSPPGDFRVLTQTGDHQFELMDQDGTVYNYGIPVNVGNNSSVPLLLSIADHRNNSVNITHNANGAITAVSSSQLPGMSWSFVYSTINGIYSRVTRIDDPFNRSCTFSYDTNGRLTGQTDMGGLAYSYAYAVKNTIDNNIYYGGQTAAPQLFVTSITTPTGVTQIETEPADGISGGGGTPAELDDGYWSGYPAPGLPMWTNYRVTIKDHLNHPTEYYFCGYNSIRYIRNPIQMQRSPGFVRPDFGARIQMDSQLVGGKGEIVQVTHYSSQSTIATSSSSSSHDAVTRLPAFTSNGNGGQHYSEYNSQGKPTLINLDGVSNDSQISVTYMPNGIDVETVKRPLLGVMKTLQTNVYDGRLLYANTDAAGRNLIYTWFGDGRLQEIRDYGTTGATIFNTITYAYDVNRRPLSVSLNGTVISSTGYDIKGNLLSQMGADGRQTTFEYDNLNRVTKEIRSDDSFTAYQWACCYVENTRYGKIVGGIEKTLRRSATTYDARVLPTATTETDGSVTRYAHDIAGRMTSLTDPKGQSTYWQFNAANQLLKKIYPDITEEGFAYDAYGRLATFTNRRNQATSLAYAYDGKADSVGNVSFGYDSWRRLSQQSNYVGVHNFTYDLLGRQTSINGPWADDTISYAYNDNTKAVTRTSPGGMIQTTTPNAYGQIVSVANILGTFTNTYSGLGGQLTQITHTGANAGFNTAFTYLGAAFDRALATITSTRPGAAVVGRHTYTYDSLGNIASWKREAPLVNPTGITSQYQSTIYYDPADQLSSVVNQALAGSTVANTGYHYTYDLAGNIASKQVDTTSTGATMTPYTHNPLNQITSVGGAAGGRKVTVRGTTSESATVKVKPGIASVYKDARMLSGNRFEADLDLASGANQLNVQAKDGSNNTSNYTYNLNLAAATALSPTYDADGNLLSDGVRSYEWDDQSRLTKILWGAGSNKSTQYNYNALGQRCQQSEYTGTTLTATYYYLYEGKDLLCRFTNGTASTNRDRHYFAQGEQRKTGSTWASRYYTREHLGSIREVLDSNGTLAARFDYDPYGKRSTQYQAAAYTGGCDFGFTGHITQTSAVCGQGEIVLTVFRAYDPELGRWLSVDPQGEAGGMNLYAYVGGNPLNWLDPYGLEPDLNLNPHGLSECGAADKVDLFKNWAKSIDNSDKRVFQVFGHGFATSILDMRSKSSADRPLLHAPLLVAAMKAENLEKFDGATHINSTQLNLIDSFSIFWHVPRRG
jgi:RHS repeat-associated protein